MSHKWYIIHTTPGYELKVKERILARCQTAGASDSLGDILIPSEEVMELKNGKKVTTTRRLFPGYIFAQLDFNDAVWHLISKTPNVTGFVSPNGSKPTPMKDSEINNILDRMNKTAEKPAHKITFEKGEPVRVIEGPFKDFTANVESVDYDKGKLRINVTVFGRETPMEIGFGDVEKTS